MSALVEVSGTLAALAAGCAALAWLLPRIRAAFRTLDAVELIVTRELTHNHGTSIKDDTYGTALAVHINSGRLDVVETNLANLETTLATLADANNLIWPAIEAVANAQPPERPSHE